MSDPTYNRKQGVQKYWAMFQRERRKRMEDNFKIRACQVPPWDYERPFYPQLEHYIQFKKYTPACTVFSEMYNFCEELLFKSDSIEYLMRKNTERFPGLSVEETAKLKNDIKQTQFRADFKLEGLSEIIGLIKISDNITYMEKVRLGNVFPDNLTKREFEQWGVVDKYPKPECDLATGTESPWCNCRVFKQYYDEFLTLLEYVDTTCRCECKAVVIASEAESVAFKNYIGIKRGYAEIMSKIRYAVKLRTAAGVNKSKTINDWAREFGFEVDASYELLYDVISTDKKNYDHACETGKDCVSSEQVQLRFATSINPQNVSLSELEDFVGKTLRSSVEGVAARSLAGAQHMVALRKTSASLTMAAFAECKSEFTSFINVWKHNYCSTKATGFPHLPPLRDLQGEPMFQRISDNESGVWKDLEHQLDSFNTGKEKAEGERSKIKLKPNNPEAEPLRKIWGKYQEERKKISAVEEAEKQRDAKEEAEKAEEKGREKQAELIVEKLIERKEELIPPPPMAALGLPPRVDPANEQDLDNALTSGLITIDQYASRMRELAALPQPLPFAEEEESKEELNPREEKDDIGGYREADYDNGYSSDSSNSSHGFD